MVRMLLDEPSYEYFGTQANPNLDFDEALRQACEQVIRECWYRGEKEAYRTEWVEETLTMDAAGSVALSNPFIFVESVKSNYKGGTAIFNHAYVAPTIFFRRQMRALSETPGSGALPYTVAQNFTSRLEYTIAGGRIYANREVAVVENNQNLVVSYIRMPTLPVSVSDPIPLAEYIHGVVCDTAAGILYRKEHPGDDRPGIGGIVDLEATIIKALKGEAQ